LIRDTRIGTRHEREEKEAEMEGAALMADEDEVESEDEEGDEVDAEIREGNDDIGLAWLQANEEELVGHMAAII
jgi:hypothetical protein